MRKRVFRQGFTITELSLSIAFIAILSIAVVLIITNTISSYHRGLTLNKINTAGMDIVDDMRAAIQNSPGRSVEKQCVLIYGDADIQKQCEDDHAHNFISVVHNDEVEVGGNRIGNVPVYGAFCTGAYSFIWNSGYYFSPDAKIRNGESASLKYKIAGAADGSAEIKTVSNFKLLKIQDADRTVCISSIYGANIDSNRGKYVYDLSGEGSINQNSPRFDISSYNAIDEEPLDILDSNVYINGAQVNASSSNTRNNLAIYNLTSASPSESSSHNSLFYSVSFILGTIQGGINIKATGNFCSTPEGYNSAIENFDYCAINKFNFAAQAMGG